MRISVFVSPQLQALRTVLRGLPAETRQQIRKWTKTDGLPIWQESIAGHAETRLELRLAATARVSVQDRGIFLQAARVGKALPGGLSLRSQWYAVEFGADREKLGYVNRPNRSGKPYLRHTARQLRSREPKGRVIFPAMKTAIPKLASLWVQTVLRAVHQAHEDASDG